MATGARRQDSLAGKLIQNGFSTGVETALVSGIFLMRRFIARAGSPGFPDCRSIREPGMPYSGLRNGAQPAAVHRHARKRRPWHADCRFERPPSMRANAPGPSGPCGAERFVGRDSGDGSPGVVLSAPFGRRWKSSLP